MKYDEFMSIDNGEMKGIEKLEMDAW